MMTNNNFWTLTQKWGTFSSNTKEPPQFFKQSFSLYDKIIVPYDELSQLRHKPLSKYVPHMFIVDEKQTVFAENPKAHSDILDEVFAVFSPDYSNFVNSYIEFNNIMILLNRLVASAWQQMGRYVVLTLSWSTEETFDVAFGNIDKGSVVALSTEGITDWHIFRQGFEKAVHRIEPVTIYWKGVVPYWVDSVYDVINIVQIEKRHDIYELTERMSVEKMQGMLF